MRLCLDVFDQSGDLAQLSEFRLLELTRLLARAHDLSCEILREHERNCPSTITFALSFLSGVGGLILVEPTTASVVVVAGGVLAAAKSVYDRGAHLFAEQRHLALFWDVSLRREALKIELIRRGIRIS